MPKSLIEYLPEIVAEGKREQIDFADQRIRFARQGQKRFVPRRRSVRSIDGRVEKQAVLRRQPAGDAGFAVRRFGDGLAAHAQYDRFDLH